MTLAVKGLTTFVRKLKRFVSRDALDKRIMRATGTFAAGLIRKRTRLGYGVPEGSSNKKSLKAMRQHSPRYALWRKKNPNKLTGPTKPARHNLTLTGQMLESLQVLSSKLGKVVIAPKGRRTDGFNNYQLGNINTKLGWRFNDLTGPEEKQVTRFFRKTFGDLVNKKFR